MVVVPTGMSRCAGCLVGDSGSFLLRGGSGVMRYPTSAVAELAPLVANSAAATAVTNFKWKQFASPPPRRQL